MRILIIYVNNKKLPTKISVLMAGTAQSESGVDETDKKK